MISPKPKWRKCLAFVPTSIRVLLNAVVTVFGHSERSPQDISPIPFVDT